MKNVHEEVRYDEGQRETMDVMLALFRDMHFMAIRVLFEQWTFDFGPAQARAMMAKVERVAKAQQEAWHPKCYLCGKLTHRDQLHPVRNCHGETRHICPKCLWK